MTGTRSKLVAIYAIQILTLFSVGIYWSIFQTTSNVDTKNNNWSRLYHPFVVDRSGITYLKKKASHIGSGGTIHSLLNNLKDNAKFLNQVEFDVVIHSQRLESQIVDDLKGDVIIDLIQKGLDNYIERDHINTPFVTVKSMPTTDYKRYECDEPHNLLTKFHHKTGYSMNSNFHHQAFIYNLYIEHGCNKNEQTNFVINDYGDMLIQLPDLNWDDDIKQTLLSSSIPQFLLSWLNSLSISKKQLLFTGASSSSVKVISTLIDNDPGSHGNRLNNNNTMNKATSSKAIHHYELISRMLQDEMNSSIIPMYNQLVVTNINPDSSTTHGIYESLKPIFHGVTYLGNDILDRVTKNEYTNDIPNDFTISVNDAYFMMTHGSLGEILLLESESSSNDMNEIVHNIAFYVPPSTSTPLFILDDETWGPAIEISSRNSYFSFVNLDVSDNQSIKIQEESYREAVRESISYIASQIRHSYGLSSKPMNAIGMYSLNDSNNVEISVHFHYGIPSSVGIAPWEVDMITRHSSTIKVNKCVEVLEATIALVQLRRSIAFPIEIAKVVEKCLNSLTSAIMNGKNLSHKEQMHLINSSIDDASLLMATDLIIELPYVAYDHLFAVFGSLIVPSLAPILKNLNLSSFVLSLKNLVFFK